MKTRLAVAGVALLLIGGVAACGDPPKTGASSSAQTPADKTPTSAQTQTSDKPTTDKPSESGSGATQESCVVGYWVLDVPDYVAQSENYLASLKAPVVGFTGSGSGHVDIGADGVITGVMDLVYRGTIVAGGQSVPFEQPSSYTFSGRWESTDGPAIRLKEWRTVNQGPAGVAGAPSVPGLTFPDTTKAEFACSAKTLTIGTVDAPLKSTFTRSS